MVSAHPRATSVAVYPALFSKNLENFCVTRRGLKKEHSIRHGELLENKAGYTATEVACGWEGAVMKKDRQTFWPSVTDSLNDQIKCFKDYISGALPLIIVF